MENVRACTATSSSRVVPLYFFISSFFFDWKFQQSFSISRYFLFFFVHKRYDELLSNIVNTTVLPLVVTEPAATTNNPEEDDDEEDGDEENSESDEEPDDASTTGMDASSIVLCCNYVQFLISIRYSFARAHVILQRLQSKTKGVLDSDIAESIDACYTSTLKAREMKHASEAALAKEGGKGQKSEKGGKKEKKGKKGKKSGKEDDGTVVVSFDRVQLAIVRGRLTFHSTVTMDKAKCISIVQHQLLPLVALAARPRFDVLVEVALIYVEFGMQEEACDILQQAANEGMDDVDCVLKNVQFSKTMKESVGDKKYDSVVDKIRLNGGGDCY